MRKYLFNRVLRSIFSVIMVMLLSIILIFSLYPLQKIVETDEDIKNTKSKQGEDASKVKILETFEYYGYTDYVSINDYCSDLIGANTGSRYKTCISRLDTNEHKQAYLKKYRDLGWEEITLQQYKGVDGKGEHDNCDVVTREVVESGAYEKKPGQFFKTLSSNNNEPHKDDYLYEEDGKTVVTYNNITYFQKRKNPFKIFWSWISNLVTIDTKNSVEEYIEWNNETKNYDRESDYYKLVFAFKKDGKIEDSYRNEFEYFVNEYDENLEFSEMTILESDENENTQNKTYLSLGGVSTSVESDKGVTIDSVNKKSIYKDSDDTSKGGQLELDVTFSNSSTEQVTVDVLMFLKNDIPVYAGSDNFLYIGNNNTGIQASFESIGYDEDFNKVQIKVNRFVESYKYTPASAERGYSVQLDEYGAPALVCKGCEYKYKIYFDNVFPYIHFNFVEIKLGESIFIEKKTDTLDLLFNNQGEPVKEEIEYPSGESKVGSISSFHTCKFNERESTEQQYFVDNYTNCQNKKTEYSMILTSFIMGIFATMIAYFIGVPVGVLMARYKDKAFDKISMVYIIVMFSVPSLAYIYFFQVIATSLFNLEVTYKFGQISTYILPIVSLSLGSIASMMMWTRRYMIDQGNSDYVKFARAKGLSESQIFFKHTLRNAIVPIAHGVPGSIIGAVAGALVTEQIYNVPGTGKLMVTAIQKYDNWIAIGLIFFYSVLGIISMILGDIVITLVDPRISFVDTGGRK